MSAELLRASIEQEWCAWYEHLAHRRIKRPSPICLQFRSIDVGVLEAALAELLRRHAVLRTNLAIVDGCAQQVVSEPTTVRLPVLDVPIAGLDGSRDAIARFVEHAATKGVDVRREPLFRPSLIRVADGEHVLVAIAHPAVCDEWSVSLIERQITSIYCDLKAGPLAPQPAQRLGFAHYCREQRQRETSKAVDDQLVYWSEVLKAAPLMTRLPLGQERVLGTAIGHNRCRVSSTIPLGLSARLQTLLGSRPPLELTMLSSFLILVARYTGQTDLIVSFINRNRARRELEGVIGPLAKPMLLRVRLPDGRSFSQLLAAVHNALSGALLHDEPSQERLVEEVLTPSASEHGIVPSIDVVFEWSERPQEMEGACNVDDPCVANIAVPPSALTDGSQVPSVPAPLHDWALDAVSNTMFQLSVAPTSHGVLACEVDGAFHPAAGQRLLSQYAALLAQIAVNPQLPVATYAALTREEATEFTRELKKLTPASSVTPTLSDEFEGQARHNPNRPAIRGEDYSMTYSELDEWSARLAERLRAARVVNGTRVGLCVGPGPAAVAAVLGIWKAGATVVALDPRDPPRRIASVLRDSRVDIVVCEQGESAELGPTVSRFEISGRGDDPEVDSQWDVISGDGRNLAWIFYGSEHSAPPAGVMLTHDAIRNVVVGLGAGPYDKGENAGRALSVSLDSSPVEDRFLRQVSCLFHGHTLRAAGADLGDQYGGLLADLGDGRVDAVDCTGVEFESLIAKGLGAVLKSRKSTAGLPVLVVGSRETADSKVGPRLFACGPCRVYAVYGPPEASFAATIGEVKPREAAVRPVGNVASFVLSRRGQPVPTGSIGELHLGGQGLARGYYGCPELTADSFVAVGQSDGANVRLYRTGQFARLLFDGSIDILGPMRDHLEFCGYRIRRARIEAALARCPGVGQVALAIHDSEPDDKRLVAYVVENGTAPTLSELRRFLWTQLPGSVWPAALVVVPHLAFTSDGGLDTSALPSSEALSQSKAKTEEAPTTRGEGLLASDWARELGVDRVAADRSYWGSFEFLNVVDRVRAGGVRITNEQLYRHRNLDTLGAAMAAEAVVG